MFMSEARAAIQVGTNEVAVRALSVKGTKSLVEAPGTPGLPYSHSLGVELRIDHFSRTFSTEDGQIGGFDEADLLEDGGLIPIDVLVRELAITKLYDGDQRHFDVAIGRGDSRQHPRHFLRVREREDHLVHNPILANRPGNGTELRIGRHARNEIARIELSQRLFAVSASQRWDVVDV